MGDPTTIPPDASDSLLNYPFVPLPEMTTTEQSGDTTFIYKGRLYVYPAGTEGDGTQSFLFLSNGDKEAHTITMFLFNADQEKLLLDVSQSQ